MNKILKKIDYRYIIPTFIHFIITFISDKRIFDFNNMNWKNYISCKVLLLIILFAFWQYVSKLVKKDKEAHKYFKYFVIYMIPIITLFLFLYPGNWFGSDVFNFHYLTIKGEFLYYLNYLSSVFYIIAYMLFPIPTGAPFLVSILFGITFSYIAKNFYDIYKSKLVYLFLIPFFMFHTLLYTFYANRPIMFGISYLLLISIILIDKIKQNKLTTKKLISIAILTGIVGYWRSESIYLVLAIPLFIFITYKINWNLKNIIKIFGICILSFVIVSLPQKIVELKEKTSVPSSRNLPMFVNPLSYMLTQDLQGDNLEEDLEKINNVLDIELMKKYASYEETYCIWNEGGCIKEYTTEEYNEFMTSYKNVMKNNLPLFIKTKILTFANASGIFVDRFTTKNLYKSDNDFILGRKDTKSLFGYEIRKMAYSIIEGKKYNEKNPNIIWRMTNNLLIPLIIIGLIFIYSIIKKDLFYFLLTGMLLGHTSIVFITAPASYFMYYFNVYITGLFLGVVYIVNYFYNKNNKKRRITL